MRVQVYSKLSRPPLDPDAFESAEPCSREVHDPSVKWGKLGAVHENPDPSGARGECGGGLRLAEVSAAERNHPRDFLDELEEGDGSTALESLPIPLPDPRRPPGRDRIGPEGEVAEDERLGLEGVSLGVERIR